MNRITATLLCLVLCLAGASIPTASAASRLTTSSSTALTSCLQQEYLMRDAYQNVLAQYPTLTAFGTVTTDEVAMIATLKNLYAKYKITIPADAKVSASRTIATTATSITNADAVAISLEQSTATLMTQLSRTTDNRDVANVVTLVKTTSLGSHTATFTTEQASVATPAPTPAPAPTASTQRVVSFTPNQTSSEFLTLLADESIDVIELSGTYHLPEIDINIDRTHPVVVRPAAGATVVMSGAASGGNPQLMFGYDGPAGNITMQNLIFDGYILRKQGIVQGFDCHDITLNDMVVRNSRADGTYAQPYQSWAIYLVADATHYPVNFTADRWTVDVVDRQMCGVKICGGSHVTLSGWSVSHAYFAVYGGGSWGPLNDFVLDDWTISDVGGPEWGSSNMSVGIADASGRFSNMHLVSSGEIVVDGTPRMTDGGNSL